MNPGDLVRIVAGPHAGEYGWYERPAPITMHEAQYVHPPRTLFIVLEESERALKFSEEEIDE